MVGPSAKDVQIAMGVAANAIVAELIAALRIKGILTEAECAKITNNALLSIENMDRDHPTAALLPARHLLAFQAQTCKPSGRIRRDLR